MASQSKSGEISFKVSVRSLVEFACMAGSLTISNKPGATAQEGIKTHQMLQKRRPKPYEAEVKFSSVYQQGEHKLLISGRADGIDESKNLVEEIKTNVVDAHTLSEQTRLVHLAQAKIYAYIWSVQKGLLSLTLRITYYNLHNNLESSFDHEVDNQELKAFYESCCSTYLEWQIKQHAHVTLRNKSIDQLTFPYADFRDGQRQLSENCFKAISLKRNLLVQAPTGIGKTLATMFPAIKAMNHSSVELIAYLTSKNQGHQVAIDAIKALQNKDLKARAVILTSKEKSCLNIGAACDRNCPYANHFFDKFVELRNDIFNQQLFDQQVLKQIAQEHEICPYYLSKQLLPYVDIIVGDYNYGIDSDTSFNYLEKPFTLLMDEFHNLPDRARSLYSQTLNQSSLKYQINHSIDALKTPGKKLLRAFSPFKQSETVNKISEKFVKAIDLYLESIENQMEEINFTADELSIYFDCFKFKLLTEEFNGGFVFDIEVNKKDKSTSINCLDPSESLKKRFQMAQSVIGFSATLSPFEMVANITGIKQDDKITCLDLPSPYNPEHLKINIVDISTYYKHREQTLAALGNCIVEHWHGHTMVFFPSYQYMQMAIDQLANRIDDNQLMVQSPNMNEQARTAFLKKFKQQEKNIAFVVLGGVFSESVDLVGEQLSSVIVVGVGMPQINTESKKLQLHYEKKSLPGFDYVFIYPGVQKVIQAAGRVIRSESDKGYVTLIDSRWHQYPYKDLLPKHWKLT